MFPRSLYIIRILALARLRSEGYQVKAVKRWFDRSGAFRRHCKERRNKKLKKQPPPTPCFFVGHHIRARFWGKKLSHSLARPAFPNSWAELQAEEVVAEEAVVLAAAAGPEPAVGRCRTCNHPAEANLPRRNLHQSHSTC